MIEYYPLFWLHLGVYYGIVILTGWVLGEHVAKHEKRYREYYENFQKNKPLKTAIYFILLMIMLKIAFDSLPHVIRIIKVWICFRDNGVSCNLI